MTAAASQPFFGRYRILWTMVLVLTVVSLIQIQSGGIGKKFRAEHVTTIGECLRDEGYAATLQVSAPTRVIMSSVPVTCIVISEDLGAIDLPAIIAHQVPPPVATKFMVASSLSRLKAILEAYVDTDEPPKLLYDYYGYNVLRVGQFYVAIAQSLGDINVLAVLTHATASPPPERFLIAHNIWSLSFGTLHEGDALLESCGEGRGGSYGSNLARKGEVAPIRSKVSCDLQPVSKSPN